MIIEKRQVQSAPGDAAFTIDPALLLLRKALDRRQLAIIVTIIAPRRYENRQVQRRPLRCLSLVGGFDRYRRAGPDRDRQNCAEYSGRRAGARHGDDRARGSSKTQDPTDVRPIDCLCPKETETRLCPIPSVSF